MKLITSSISQRINTDIIAPLSDGNFSRAATAIITAIDELYAAIPAKKRISYGIVYTIRTLSEHLFVELSKLNIEVLSIARGLYAAEERDKSKGVALGIISFCGLESPNLVLDYFIDSAASDDWQMREFAQMFFKKLIKKYPSEMKAFLLKQVKSDNPNIRRFVSETLRPVQENRWFNKEPEYSLEILKHLFNEPVEYPRVSVGNNLSDLARQHPEMVFDIVEKLVARSNKNSYRIAYRACRNLVKKEPIRVMDILKTDEYKYKKAIYRRSEYQGN